MKRLFTVALITAMLGFTGTANAGDVAISVGKSQASSDGVSSMAWVVINNSVFFCMYQDYKGGKKTTKWCQKIDKYDD
jgi:hypothetical protein